MGQPETMKIAIREFGGMNSAADPPDIKPGVARVQVNVSAQRPSELRPRLGYARVTFED